MQRKVKILLTIIIFGCNIFGLSEIILEKKIISRAQDYFTCGFIVEAAEAVDEEDKEQLENEESKEIDENEKETIKGLPEKEEDLKSAIDEETEQKELTINKTEEKAEIMSDTEKDEIRFQEEEERIAEEITHETARDDCIYNVSFPTNPKAYLDPGNLSGKGQVFSNDFMVENYGNTDIAVKIKNIEVYYRSTENVYELSKEDATDAEPYVKKINVDIVWRNEIENTEKVLAVIEGHADEYVLFLKAAEYDNAGQFVRLDDGSTGLFYFTGTMSSNPELIWEDGEITVSFDYEIEKMENEESERLDEQEETMLQEDREIPKEQGNLEPQENQKIQEEQYELELQKNQEMQEEIEEQKIQENQKKKEPLDSQENQKIEDVIETQDDLELPVNLEAEK